jgi:transposase-like protein
MTEQRYRAVLEVQAGVPVTEVAERFGVSRQAVHRWIGWYRDEGLNGLADRSHRPRAHPAQTSPEVEAAICELRKLRQVRDQLDAGLPPADDRLSVGDFLGHWMSVNLPGSVAPSTEDDYGDTVRLHLRPGLGRKKLTKLTVRECDQLWQTKRAAGYSSNSIRIMRTVLRKAMGQAEREGLVPRNVAALSAPPRVSAKEGRTLTLDQA